jgi:hypothetical protein
MTIWRFLRLLRQFFWNRLKAVTRLPRRLLLSARAWVSLTLLVIALLVAYYVLETRHTPFTSDAYVQAYVVQVAPRFQGLNNLGGGHYAEQAGSKLEEVAQQFQRSPGHAARVEQVRWQPNVLARWDRASENVGPIADGMIDPFQAAVIARCLDQIAMAVERISGMVLEINARNVGR